MITRFSSSKLTYTQRYRGVMAGLKAVLPAYIIKLVNSRAYGGLGGAYVDSSGNAYVNASNNNGGSDGGQITQKIAPDNSVLWSYSYPNAYGGETALHVDSSDNIYTGGFHGNSPGDYYMLATKVSSAGALQWQRWFGGSVTYPDGLAVNKNGYSVMSGGSFTSGCFILLDSAGNTVFTRSGNLGNESGEGGYTAGIGPNRVFFGHRRRFNIFDMSGNFQFGKSVSNFRDGGAVRGISDSQNNIYIWSTNDSTISYLTKFNSSGTQIWDRQITAPSGNVWASGHADIDSNDNIYIPFGWTVTVGSATSQKIAWMSFDSNGNTRYMRSVDSSGLRDSAGGINVNSSDGRGFVGAYFAGNNGALVSFDTVTGNIVPATATVGGTAATLDNLGWSVTTPATLSYITIADIGGSTSVSSVSRGSSGGSGQYSISRANFG
jgi:hypothetical protein